MTITERQTESRRDLSAFFGLKGRVWRKGACMLFDLTHVLKSGMPVYPGDPVTELVPIARYESGGYRLTRLDTGLHAGTHIDMPSHFSADERTASDLPLSCFITPARVFRPGDDMSCIREGEAVLIATGWDRHLGAPDYFTAHPVVSEAVASLLISKNIRILGLDTPSPDLPPFAVHRRLSEAGIFLAENLRGLCPLYEAAREQVFTFYAVPLKISAEASPIRAFAVLS